MNTKLPNADEGVFYEYRIVPSEPSEGPFLFEALDDNLPEGFVLSSDGVVSGATCDGRGNKRFSVRITRIPDLVGEFDFSIKIDGQGNPNLCEAEVPILQPSSLGNGVFGLTYEQILFVENSTGNYAFQQVSGTLPNGVSLSAEGVLSGTPTETGSFRFRVEATASQADTVSREYSLIILPVIGGLVVSPESLPNGVEDQSYSQQLSASGGISPYTFSIEDDSSLPPGISFSSAGLVFGTPTTSGVFPLVVNVVDNEGNNGTASYTLTIDEANLPPVDLTISPPTVPSVDYGAAYSEQLTASAGDGSYSFSLSGGGLPAGISLSNAGLLSGTAAATGSFDFTVSVLDGQGNTGSQDYTLVVNAVDGLIVITPEVLPQATFGAPYNITLGATGGDGNYTGSLTGDLPDGISFDPSDGTFAGTPTQTGTFPLTVVVTDGQGNTGQKNYNLVVVPVNTLEIAPPILDNATFGVAYSEQLTASGGVDGTYEFALSAGTLPNGVILGADGLLSGVPTEAGDFTFGVSVSDGAGNTGQRALTLTVERLTDLDIQPETLPAGSFGNAYGQQLTASGGDGTYVFGIETGSLPSGLQLGVNGLLFGIPTETGDFPITVIVLDGQLNSGTRDYTLRIDAVSGLLTILPESLPTGKFGQAYSVSFNTSGRAAPYTFSLNVGPLPAGLDLAADGTLSGTPTQVGSFPITVGVTDAQNNDGSRDYTLVVDSIDSLEIAPSVLPDATYGTSYSQQLTATGGSGALTFALSGGALPTGIQIGTDGLISGTPTQTGDFQIEVTVTDSQGNSGVKDYTITVTRISTLTISPPTVPSVDYGAAYSEQLTASGGDGSYSFSLSGGGLPAGISLSNAGLLSGSAAATGSFDFTVSVLDGQGNTGSQDYTLVVNAVDGLIVITPEVLPQATFGAPYNITLGATGGDGNYTGSLTGDLPDGISFDPSDGTFAGTPTQTGTFPLTVVVTDGQGNTGQKNYNLVVVPVNTLEIAPPILDNATFGVAYSEQLTASGGVDGTYEFALSAGTLPNGVILGADGLLSGVPTEAGDFTFGVSVSDGAGNTGQRALTLTVERLTDLDIQPETLPAGSFGNAYGQQLTASGGDGTYVFGIETGSLPSGLQLGVNGLLFGIPTETGDFPITVIVLDGQLNSGTRDYTLRIDAVSGLLTILPESLPTGKFGQAYSVSFNTSGGAAPYTFSLNVGPLPAGLDLAADGTLSGTPTQVGSFPITVGVTDAQNNDGSRDYTLVVDSIDSLEIAPSVLPDATYGTSYSQQLTATGGSGALTFALSGGALPTGIQIGTDGLISGTPTQTGDFQIEVTVTDSQGNSGVKDYTITVSPDPSLIVVNPASIPAGTFGMAYSQIFSATGGSGAYSYSVSDGELPTGLSLNSNGTLSGVPAVVGTFNFTIGVQDEQRNEGSREYELLIAPTTGLSLQPSELADGVNGQSYTQQIGASGGDGNYTFRLSSGALPDGLALSASGLISGVPTTSAVFPDIEISVEDGQGNTGNRFYIITVNPNPDLVAIAPPELPPATFGVGYDLLLSASGGTAPYTYSVVSGGLPAGVNLVGDRITGTPIEVGLFSFRVQALDSDRIANSGTKDYTLTVERLTDLSISPSSLSDGTYNTAYSEQLTATGGSGTYNFAQTSGSLPAGIALETTGLLSGTPLETGTFSFTATVIDEQSNTGTRDYTLVIDAIPGLITITPDTLPVGRYGTFYEVTLGATGGDGDYTPSLTGALPAGISFDTSDGTFRGTPTETGSFPVTVDVLDGQGNTGQKAYTLVIDSVSTLAIAPETLPIASFGVAYSQQLSASGGSPAYSFVRSSGTLPAGLTLDTNGLISGTPTQTGSFQFTAEVTDAQDNTGQRTYTLVVEALTTLAISPTDLPEAMFRTGYSQQLTASGGVDGTYQFRVKSGALPAGIVLTGNGLINGSASVTGSFDLTIEVSDEQDNRGSQDYTLVVNAVDDLIVITPESLPPATFGSVYEVTLGATGGDGDYTPSLTGTLPAGISFDTSDGTFRGTPTETGSFPVTVDVVDGQGNTGQKSYVLEVLTISVIEISPAVLSNATFNQAYSQQLTADGGTGSYVFSTVNAGGPSTTPGLPEGIALSPSGLLSGTPTETGDFTFSVNVDDTEGNTGQRTYTLTVERLTDLSISPSSLSDGTYNTAYSEQLTATGGSGTYNFAQTSGSLPAGIALETTGLLSGTPLETGTFSFTATVIDEQSNTGTRDYTLVIDAIPGLITITPDTLSDAVFGSTYFQALSAAGGEAPYEFFLESGALPSGITLTIDGDLAGSPKETGDFVIGITVEDSQGNTGTKDYIINVAPAKGIIAINPATVPAGETFVEYSTRLSAKDGIAPYSYSVVGGELPSGLLLGASTGVILGLPEVAGTFNFTVQAVDSQGNTGTVTYGLIIEEGRPDPSEDQEVIELIERQFGVARELVENHRQSITRRLEELREKFECGELLEECLLIGGWQEGRYVESDYSSLASYAIGIDYQVRSDTIVGLSFGYGQTKSDIGQLGSALDAESRSIAAYFTHKFGQNSYFDGVIGVSNLDYQTQRYLTGAGGFEVGNRNGDAKFISLRVTQSRQMTGGSLLSLYARYDAQRTKLDSYSESNATGLSLSYNAADQDFHSFSAGVNAERSFIQSWGMLTGWIEGEFSHQRIGGYTQTLYYSDTPETTYTINRPSDNQNVMSIRGGLDIMSGNSVASIEVFTAKTLNSSSSASVGVAARYQIEF
ncbi:putative Ig domain-containing protein [Shimia abyssi]|uniref:putative Ig domain-containing protein n=1 Tax=Shimia abyssi TaxID=1662395 RepID=UPI0013FDDF52|nr:putative Ig domain-containing protein [Shimia abyssi]